MQKDDKAEGNREEALLVEYASMRQLNEERLRFLNSRLPDAVTTGSDEAPEQINSPFSNFQASVPEPKVDTPVASLQKKFSTSWLNMQNYLSERKAQSRNGEQKNR